MELIPANVEDLSNAMACAFARGERVQAVCLDRLGGLVEHKAEDMTATVLAGTILSRFQEELSKARQWLPIDPPNASHLTIAQLLDKDLNGARRFGYGTVRDYVIGLTVVLADGRVIQSGGKVVKNVAGYDLAKLFIGAQGSLGVIVEATFKLRPIPEAEHITRKICATLDEAVKLVDRVLSSDLTPVILDVHNVGQVAPCVAVVAGFAGTQQEVEWQLEHARALGFVDKSSLTYCHEFWADGRIRKLSVLPSKLDEAVRSLSESQFVARAGNGIIFHQGSLRTRDPRLPTQLMRRVKQEFDPKQILPELPL